MWAPHAAEMRLYEVHGATCQNRYIHAISFRTHIELKAQQTCTPSIDLTIASETLVTPA